MKKYLITGCAGFIGSNFVHYMLKKYDDILLVNLDKLTYAGNLENLKSIEGDERHVFVQGDICDEKLVFVRTGNDIVNAVVNLKLSAAKSIGIDCTYSSVADFTGIEDSDLCSLLSNLLDNAITAAAGSTRKILQLNISADEWSYLFSVKNSIDSSVLDVNPSLSTTKTENYCHGIGTLIVGDIAKKYEGIYDVYEESGFFCCNVLLNKNL